MLVLPCRANIFLDYKKIYQVFLACKHYCQKSNCTQIVSISLEIDLVEPLIVLQEVAKPDELNFYLENKSKGEAIAAIDAVATLQIVL